MAGSPDPSSPDSADGSGLAGFAVDAPPLPTPVFTHQHWADLTFLHWPVAPESVAHLYPAGSRPDVFADGRTYVGLVPFAMSDVSLVVSRPIPYFGRFLETNVRLYSTDDEGRHGVLFRSLETTRLAVVPVTRIGLGTPYTWARMRLVRQGDRITYDSVRRAYVEVGDFAAGRAFTANADVPRLSPRRTRTAALRRTLMTGSFREAARPRSPWPPSRISPR